MTFSVIKVAILDVLILEPNFHRAKEGFFFQSFNQRDFVRATGLDVNFI